MLIDSDGHEIKKALRRGEIDFVIDTLDEAIRALKNEVRKKRPLSVALIAEVDATLAEMMERGLQPDMFLTRGAWPSAVQPLLDAGLQYFDTELEVDPAQDAVRPAMTIHGEQHYEYFIPTATPTRLREADARVLRLLPRDEAVRRRWIERASHYLRSATDGRWSYLSEGEAMLLESEGLKLREGPRLSSPEESQPTAP